ncbi:MAG: hypothetical protein IH591_20090, partial [Bacteroidales bacterium]|nr:hypothetical protein [Bacteroidales bacterium]
MTFFLTNELKKTGSITHIESARVSGAIAGTDIDLKTEGTYEIRSLSLNGISVNSPVRAEMSLDMHKSDTAITVRKGTLDLEKMLFTVSGYYLPETGITDLTIGSDDSDIRTLSGFIAAKQGAMSGYKPEGKVSAVCRLTGTINRESKIHYEVAFSLSGVKFEIPGTGLQIRESSLTGFYTNGAQNNAITSVLDLDKIEIYTNLSEVR